MKAKTIFDYLARLLGHVATIWPDAVLIQALLGIVAFISLMIDAVKCIRFFRKKYGIFWRWFVLQYAIVFITREKKMTNQKMNGKNWFLAILDAE